MKYYVKKIIQMKYSMRNYKIERDEIYNAKEEIKELNRLLEEAKHRLECKYKTIRNKTWSEWFFELFGYY